jgi:CBS domain-containing protein
VAVELELGERDVERLAGRGISPAVEAADERVPKVRDVVTGEPLVVAPEDTLGEVAEKLRERDVGSALVAEYGTLIGILTSRDLLRAFAGRVHSSEARVREWMTAEPVSVTADTSIEAAAILMAENDIHHLPVVENERPVGMVGMRDLVRAAPFDSSRPGIGLGF